MKKILMVLLSAGLTGCGADGEPVQPTRDATITLSNSGVSGVARIGLRQGPLSVSLGLDL